MSHLKYFKKTLAVVFFFFFLNSLRAQSTINSSSLVVTGVMISVGEIVVNPVSSTSSGTGIIAILSQVAAETLEVSQYNIAKDVIVYPNPTDAQIFFKSRTSLISENIQIFSDLGKLVKEVSLDSSNSLNLSDLATGIYFVRFTNSNFNSVKIIKK